MQTARIETTILSNLLLNEEFERKVLPFLRPDYFHNGSEKLVFSTIAESITKYNKLPTSEQIIITLNEAHNVPEPEFKDAVEIINSLNEQSADNAWLTDVTEKFCKDKAIYNAIVDGIQIVEGKDKNRSPDALPALLSDALSVSFDPNVGHDYFEQSDERFDFYHTKEEKIPFNLKYFDLITKGGLPSKTLNVALAGTGVGKSLFMCHLAANYMMHGKNVLYITMEMAEERIAERIDANLLNVPIDQLEHLSKDMFSNRVQSIADKTTGKLIIKEYPTGSAHANHFRALLNELKLKKQFVPDMIFIDYLNICASARMKGMGGAINSYSYIKSIAEELRGLAVEFDVPIVSATQTTRSGFTNDDVGLEDTSESFGLPATADFMFALISNDELKANNQILVKQLKNRYNDLSTYQRFVVGIDRAKMRLYDVDQNDSPLNKEVDNGPAFDNSNTGQRINTERFADFTL